VCFVSDINIPPWISLSPTLVELLSALCYRRSLAMWSLTCAGGPPIGRHYKPQPEEQKQHCCSTNQRQFLRLSDYPNHDEEVVTNSNASGAIAASNVFLAKRWKCSVSSPRSTIR